MSEPSKTVLHLADELLGIRAEGKHVAALCEKMVGPAEAAEVRAELMAARMLWREWRGYKPPDNKETP